MANIERDHLESLRQRLEERASALREEVRETLAKSDHEKAELMRDEVRDAGDDSFMDLVTDVNNADVERDVGEFRLVTAALQRMQTGDYGVCEDCGRDIDVRRLEAQPFASRCIECQERHEHLTNEGRAPSL